LEAVLTELGPCPPAYIEPTNQRPLRVRVNRGQRGTWYSNWDEIADYAYENLPGCPERNYGEDEDASEEQEQRDADLADVLEKFKEAKLVLPELPAVFVPPAVKPAVSLRDRPLQVIAKIATIELNPEAPKYEGGTWHVEGMPDERIVATACVYLEAHNVTESSLRFRTPIKPPTPVDWGVTETAELNDDPAAPANAPATWDTLRHDDEAVRTVYGFGPGAGLVQPRGTSRTLPGRVLAWPNTLQHCVAPFELADPTQRGHRTIVCFFLVDPTVRVRSSATVPPQAREWYEKEVRAVLLQTPLKALELRDLVITFLGDLGGLMTYAQAAERRARLMKERTAAKRDPNELEVPEMYIEEISFCEH
jgi:hypothetical protein